MVARCGRPAAGAKTSGVPISMLLLVEEGRRIDRTLGRGSCRSRLCDGARCRIKPEIGQMNRTVHFTFSSTRMTRPNLGESRASEPCTALCASWRGHVRRRCAALRRPQASCVRRRSTRRTSHSVPRWPASAAGTCRSSACRLPRLSLLATAGHRPRGAVAAHRRHAGRSARRADGAAASPGRPGVPWRRRHACSSQTLPGLRAAGIRTAS